MKKEVISQELYNVMNTLVGVMKRFDPECAVELEEQMKHLTVAPEPVTITAQMVHALREVTGEGIMCCNKALRHCNGDFDDAIDYLKRSGTLCI